MAARDFNGEQDYYHAACIESSQFQFRHFNKSSYYPGDEKNYKSQDMTAAVFFPLPVKHLNLVGHGLPPCVSMSFIQIKNALTSL